MSEETRGTEAKRKGAGADVKGRALGFTLSGMGEPLRGSKQRGMWSAVGSHVFLVVVW